VGFLDALRGRRAPARPNLDALFALPSAAITLQIEKDFLPTGRGSVAFRAPEGRAFADVAAEVQALLDADGGPKAELHADDFGFDWMVVSTDPPDVPALVTDLHAVNSSLVNAGFGPQLLCSLVGFTDPEGRTLAMVYLYKQGTFYPFVPKGPAEERDNICELQIRDLLTGELPVEPAMERWFAVWNAPGLTQNS
jgi:hypothetical protein